MLYNLGAILLAGAVLLDGVATTGRFSDSSRLRQKRAAEFVEKINQPRLEARATKTRYLTNTTKPYQVASLPDVNYNIGEMYSGLMPINKGNTSRELFFIFQPTTGAPVDEVTIWLNGGPGCSSLDGFFQENGRFLWQPGVYAPVENPYSWVNLTNMLYVEQPVGTGYTMGTPVATTQEETAAEFIKFFKNFQQTFGIKNYKIYVTGESYAGRYVPFISAAMLDANDTTYYNLKGALMYDPCIGSFEMAQEEIPAYPFVAANNNLFNFNASFMAELEMMHKSCGYEAYLNQYLTYPAAGVQPQLYLNYSNDTFLNTCDIFDLINFAAFDPNPCFNIYEINSMCPLPWDVMAFPTELFYSPTGSGPAYFDRADVKKALHVPTSKAWSVCNLGPPVYTGGDSGPESEGDNSADPIQHVLPQVIEATNRVLIGNGQYDMIIITNGTLLAIQNMTWSGKLGFQTRPSTPINITLPDLQYQSTFSSKENGAGGWDGPQGVMGMQHYERGLMWSENYQAGHEAPEFQPRLTYRHIQWLLGHIESL